jgi:hypothetical protein
VAYGLLAAWAVHDLEELLAFPRWKQMVVPDLERRYPAVPDRVWHAIESASTRQFTIAVGIVGAQMAAASAVGQATGGRSRYYQLMLSGFGMHAIGHLAATVTARRYTPGAVTSPLVVAPFSAWAIHQCKRAGVWRPISRSDLPFGLALAVAVFGGSHILAHALNKIRPR